MSRISRTFGVAVMALGLSALTYGQAATTTRQMVLANAQVSTTADGKVVSTFEVKGDLRGLLTLTLNASGNEIASGEWALVVRYVEYLDHHGQPIPPGEEERVHNELDPHFERPLFVDKGTLAGTVRGGTLIRGANGAITGIESVLLSLESGSLTFEGAIGDGSAAATSLHDALTSSGSLGLTF